MAALLVWLAFAVLLASAQEASRSATMASSAINVSVVLVNNTPQFEWYALGSSRVHYRLRLIGINQAFLTDSSFGFNPFIDPLLPTGAGDFSALSWAFTDNVILEPRTQPQAGVPNEREGQAMQQAGAQGDFMGAADADATAQADDTAVGATPAFAMGNKNKNKNSASTKQKGQQQQQEQHEAAQSGSSSSSSSSYVAPAVPKTTKSSKATKVVATKAAATKGKAVTYNIPQQQTVATKGVAQQTYNVPQQQAVATKGVVQEQSIPSKGIATKATKAVATKGVAQQTHIPQQTVTKGIIPQQQAVATKGVAQQTYVPQQTAQQAVQQQQSSSDDPVSNILDAHAISPSDQFFFVDVNTFPTPVVSAPAACDCCAGEPQSIAIVGVSAPGSNNFSSVSLVGTLPCNSSSFFQIGFSLGGVSMYPGASLVVSYVYQVLEDGVVVGVTSSPLPSEVGAVSVGNSAVVFGQSASANATEQGVFALKDDSAAVPEEYYSRSSAKSGKSSKGPKTVVVVTKAPTKVAKAKAVTTKAVTKVATKEGQTKAIAQQQVATKSVQNVAQQQTQQVQRVAQQTVPQQTQAQAQQGSSYNVMNEDAAGTSSISVSVSTTSVPNGGAIVYVSYPAFSGSLRHDGIAAMILDPTNKAAPSAVSSLGISNAYSRSAYLMAINCQCA